MYLRAILCFFKLMVLTVQNKLTWYCNTLNHVLNHYLLSKNYYENRII